MKFAEKSQQNEILRSLSTRACDNFKEQYPTKTIGHHHYVRIRHLQQFLYDFAKSLLIPSGVTKIKKI